MAKTKRGDTAARQTGALGAIISVVTPAFNEELNIAPFYQAVRAVFKELPYRCELIFVDDGSRDNTAEAIANLKTTADCQVRLVQLSRNFGKEVALTAGLHQATGVATIVLDADLQHPPAYIPRFIERWQAGADVVIGVRSQDEHESLIKNLGSRLYYPLINRISEVEIKPRATDFRLLDRQVVDAYNQFTERSRMSRALIDWLGFRREYVPFKTAERMHGQATYNVRKLVQLAYNSLTAHSLFPLRVAGYLGLGLFIFSGMLGVFIILENYIYHDALGMHFSNVAMLAIFIVFLMSIVLMCLGLIAMYIAAIHAEVANRPLYVLRTARSRAYNEQAQPEESA